jgi:hypothetical protein
MKSCVYKYLGVKNTDVTRDKQVQNAVRKGWSVYDIEKHAEHTIYILEKEVVSADPQ